MMRAHVERGDVMVETFAKQKASTGCWLYMTLQPKQASEG